MTDTITISRKRYERLKRQAQANDHLILELDDAFRRALNEGIEEI